LRRNRRDYGKEKCAFYPKEGAPERTTLEILAGTPVSEGEKVRFSEQ